FDLCGDVVADGTVLDEDDLVGPSRLLDGRRVERAPKEGGAVTAVDRQEKGERKAVADHRADRSRARTSSVTLSPAMTVVVSRGRRRTPSRIPRRAASRRVARSCEPRKVRNQRRSVAPA